jgi:tetratricopeptide (TPR) repeat protein
MFEFEEIPLEWKMSGQLQADLNEGLNNLIEDNLAAAEESLNIVLKKDSSIWQAYYYRSAVLKKLNKYIGAESDAQRALKLHGDFYEGLVELAKITALRRDLVESERILNKAIRMDRTRGTAYYLKGDIDLSQRQMRSAMNKYKECLAVDSLFQDARIKLALIEGFLKNDLSSATSHLTKVLTHDSLNRHALMFRSILTKDTNKKLAVRDLSSLLRVSPDNVMARFYRGIYSAELEDYERAFHDFHEVLKLTSTSDNAFKGQQTWLDKKIDMQNAGSYTITRVYGLPDEDRQRVKTAYCHIITGKYDACLILLDQMTNKKEPVAVYLKAVAYEHKGEHMNALQHYSIAIALDNENSEAYKKRGIYMQELKRWEQSVADFDVVLKMYPDGYFTNRMRGVSYYHLNRFQDAVDDFTIFLKHDSTNNEVRSFRAMAYQQTKHKLDAYVDFALSDNVGLLIFGDAERLVDSVLHIPDTTRALYYLDVLTNATPYFTEGFVMKFRIHVARKDWKTVEQNIGLALRNSRTGVAASRHSYLLTLRAIQLARQRHTDDALKILNEAIKVDRSNDIAFVERGRLFMVLGKSSKAKEDFSEAEALGNPEARKLLASVR